MKKIRRLAYPYNLWMLIVIVAPLLLIAYYAFTSSAGSFTLDNFSNIFDKRTLKTIYNSVSIAFVSTVLCLLIGYPMAYIISKTNARYRTVAMMLIMVPMWMNFLLRTYSWVTILSPSGVLNSIMGLVGLKAPDLMYTQTAVTLGMVYNFLPFMILPIYTSLEKMDYRLVEAAHDLGANDLQAFTKVIFPLSLPGVLSGVSMVFIPAISTFEITRLLGGGKVNMIGNVIEQQFLYTGNWNYGSALALVLMIFIVISVLFDQEGKEKGGKNE